MEFDHWQIRLPKKRWKNTVFTLFSILKFYPIQMGVSLKISCIFLMESSYDIVESSRYILRDCSHMSTTEIDLYSSIVMAKKNTLKSVPLMLERNTFVCIVFERWVGQ